MSTVVKSTNENIISMPNWLMSMLNLRDGDEVKAIVEGERLRLASLNKFLALQGALRDDEAFDQAMELIEKAWQEWKINDSA